MALFFFAHLVDPLDETPDDLTIALAASLRHGEQQNRARLGKNDDRPDCEVLSKLCPGRLCARGLRGYWSIRPWKFRSRFLEVHSSLAGYTDETSCSRIAS